MFWKKPKPTVPPEWLIVGLGNPGGEYAATRHNVGFEVVDRLASKHRIKLDRSKHRARFGFGSIAGTPVLLAKPLTYMNLSGNAVGPLAREQSVAPDRILVIADDLDMPLGKVRIRRNGSAGGHNGHKSLIQALRTQEYPRIKIGIGSVGRPDAIDYVTSKFEPGERQALLDSLDRATEAVELILGEGLERAMMWINEAKKGETELPEEE